MGVAGLAGCTSSIPLIGDDSSGPSVENWLVAPSFSSVFQEDDFTANYEDGELQSNELTNREFDSVVPQAIFEHEDELLVYWPLESGSNRRSRAGVTASELDWQLSQTVEWEYEFSYTEQTWSGERSRERSRTGTVDFGTLAGSFDPDDVEESLEDWIADRYSDDEALSSEGDHAGFDLYSVQNWAFAVNGDYFVDARADEHFDAVAALEAALDAYANSTDRWTDTDDGAALLSAFEPGEMADGELHSPKTVESELERQYGSVDRMSDREREMLEDRIADEFEDWEEGLVGSATGHDFDGDTSEIREVFLFETESDVDVEAVRDHVDSNRDVGDEWATLRDYSISSDGRAVVLTGTVRTRALL